MEKLEFEKFVEEVTKKYNLIKEQSPEGMILKEPDVDMLLLIFLGHVVSSDFEIEAYRRSGRNE